MQTTFKRHLEHRELEQNLTIVVISDTHELHREVDVPLGDLVVHAGDFTMFSKNTAAILDFNEWLGELPHPFKLVAPGNHEFFLEADPSERSLITNATILMNESVEVMGLKIWGSPTTPLYGGAFGLSYERDRVRLYSQIPEDTDVLITHGPPFGILDGTPGSNDHAGCMQLMDAVRNVKPKLHVFGHIHAGYGIFESADTLFVNAALLGQNGAIDHPPITIRIPRA